MRTYFNIRHQEIKTVETAQSCYNRDTNLHLMLSGTILEHLFAQILSQKSYQQIHSSHSWVTARRAINAASIYHTHT